MPSRKQLPVRAKVTSSIDVGCLIIEATAINSSVSDCGIKMRRLDQRDFAPVAESLWSDIFPGFSTISGEVNQARIAPCPD